MADKKFTREEYERLSKENMELFAKLDKQIAEDRAKEAEYLSTLSDEKIVEYLYETEQKTDAAAEGRFKSTITLYSEED